MKHFEERTTMITPEDTEYYIEGVVMKELHDKGKIKSKVMFRRERESTHEIIKFIEKQLRVEDGDELKYEEDANNPPIETCPYRFEVNFDNIMKALKECKEENEVNSKSKSGNIS
jgi:hypothetical protein